MHVDTRPMAKNISDLKKLAGKKMFAPLQGSPVPNDTLVLTWTEKVKITWYWGNLIGLMRRRHIYNVHLYNQWRAAGVPSITAAFHHLYRSVAPAVMQMVPGLNSSGVR